MTEPRTILRWDDPDQRRKDTVTFADQFAGCVAELIAKPDTWAVIFEGPEADSVRLANAVRGGKGPFKATPERRFECKTRSRKVAGALIHDVFVRCVAGYGVSS